MKQVFIGIFAHPDDESFGPSGTLALQIQNGADVHLICATGGENGQNPDAHDDLGDARIKEWYTAGALLGVKSQHHLGFIDGTLNNNQFKDIAKKTQDIIGSILTEYDNDTEFTFITMDQNGISGHIDHITMSFVASYVFINLKGIDTRIKALWYFCVPETILPNADTSFVFRSKGRSATEIDIKQDISTVFALKKEIMRAHISQRGDAEMLIARAEQAPKLEECFYTYKG